MALTEGEIARRSETVDADTWIARGCDLIDQGRVPEALKAFREGVDRGALWANLNLGNAYEALGEWHEAALAFEAAIAAGELTARLNLANVLAYHLFRRDEARRHYELAWEEGEGAAAVGLAMLAEDDGDERAALAWLARAHERGAPQSRWRLALLLARHGDQNRAFELLSESIRDGEQGARATLAQIYRDDGRTEAAERELRAAIAEGDERAVRFLADLLAEEGRTSEAREWYERASQDDSEALLDYAIFLEEFSDDPIDSIDVYRRAVAAGDARAPYNLAHRYAELGMWDDAANAYEQAQKVGDPKASASFERWRVAVFRNSAG